jgi:hypothetical protein
MAEREAELAAVAEAAFAEYHCAHTVCWAPVYVISFRLSLSARPPSAGIILREPEAELWGA